MPFGPTVDVKITLSWRAGRRTTFKSGQTGQFRAMHPGGAFIERNAGHIAMNSERIGANAAVHVARSRHAAL